MRMQTIPHFAAILAAAVLLGGLATAGPLAPLYAQDSQPGANYPSRRSCRIPSHPFAARSDAPPPIPNPTSRSRSKRRGRTDVLLVMTDDVGFVHRVRSAGPSRRRRSTKLPGAACATIGCTPPRCVRRRGPRDQAGTITTSTGLIMEGGLGYPGYDTVMPKSCGTIAEVLRQNGYNTAWFGKESQRAHLETTAAGPFDLWPRALASSTSTASSAGT